MKELFKISILCLLLTSCGGSDSGKVSHNGNDIVARTTEAQRVAEIFNKSTVVCGESSCPDNVVKLTFYEKVAGEFQFGVCSGTLIEEGLILTNSHCVPESLSYPGANCSGRIKVKFPSSYKDSRGVEEVDCIRVRSVYNESEGEPDLALLVIERSVHKRSFPAVATGEPTSGETVYAYTMSPASARDLRGTIRKKNCFITAENNIYENDFNGRGPIISLGRDTGRACNIVGGNSGSGLFNQDGDLIGAVNAKIDGNEFKRTFKNLGFTASWRFRGAFLGMAASIKCLKSFYSHNEPHCQKQKVDGIESVTDFFKNEIEKKNLQDIDKEDLVVTINKRFEYSVAQRPVGFAARNDFDANYMHIDLNKFIILEDDPKVIASGLKNLPRY